MMGPKDLFGKKEENKVENNEEKQKEVLTADDVQALAPLYSDVVLALKQVYDPEIPVNIYDLGLIYELTINKAEVQHSVEDVPGVKSCHIDLVFDPVWDQSMLSDEARVDLGLD